MKLHLWLSALTLILLGGAPAGAEDKIVNSPSAFSRTDLREEDMSQSTESVRKDSVGRETTSDPLKPPPVDNSQPAPTRIPPSRLHTLDGVPGQSAPPVAPVDPDQIR